MEMKDRIERMAYRTWEVIGGDVLTVLEECGESPVMPRDHVIEAVCDAGYMKTYGDDAEAYEAWSELSNYKAKMEAVKGAFPYKTYGW